MKVAQLARLLDSLVQGLDGMVNTAATKDFQSFHQALQPFANSSVNEFTTFLGQFGSEFQQTGRITGQGKISLNKRTAAPKKDATQQIADAVAAVKNLCAEIDNGAVDDHRVDEVLKPIQKLTMPQLTEVLAGLGIAERPRKKTLAVGKIRQVIHHQLESYDKAASVGGRQPSMEAVGAGS